MPFLIKIFILKPHKSTYIITKDFLVSNEEFQLLHNREMDMLETFPVPEKLYSYYESDEYISHTDSTQNFTDKVYNAVKSFALRQKVSLIKSQNNGVGKLLDIGAGTGEFLLSAKQKGWHVYGVEPNEKARKLSGSKGVVLAENLQQISETDFDVITLWHVLEHLPDLENQIASISKKLKSGGTLIIAVPNFKSFDARYYKNFWAAYDVPRHLWHFSKTAVEKLFSDNYDLVKTKPMYFDAFYVSLLSEKYKTGKTKWIKAFFIGCCSNLSGMVKKEFSSHIYILKKRN